MVRSMTMAFGLFFWAVTLLIPPHAGAQDHPRLVRIQGDTVPLMRAWDAQVDGMLRTGELRIVHSARDGMVPGRTHQRVRQYHDGVAVFGGDLTRQLRDGQTVSVFGSLYTGIDLDTTPALSAEAATAIVEADAGVRVGPSRLAELTILPTGAGGYRLTYRTRVLSAEGLTSYFIDARSGEIALKYQDLHTQAAVGRARGVLNDTKKMSAEASGGAFVANDRLRPGGENLFGGIATFDMKGNLLETVEILNGVRSPTVNDLGRDSDNDWTDGTVVDAHVYSGFVYDYLFKRFGRHGLNDDNIQISSFVHPVHLEDFDHQPDEVRDTFYTNAAYLGNGHMVYGEGLPAGVTAGGRTWRPLAGALDIVAHELTHGVTEFTSDLIYLNESGALNESFSDIIATAVEFFFQEPGDGPMRADYLLGEDTILPGGIRSMADPGAYGDPDHFSLRFPGTDDNGGVHINSGISNHAYYLAIEGGTNRTSRLSVSGVGRANREQIERAFYRAFAFLMPANATFSVARQTTIQAARDLFGSGSAAERAISEAWTAVGVN